MDRFDELTNVLGVVVATVAIALSLVTVVLQRRQHQRDAYRQIYDTLMSDPLHRGRWLILGISRGDELPADAADLRLMFRTLGTFDNLAMYVRHRLVPREWVMDVWHHPLREMREGAERVRAAFPPPPGPRASQVYWPELWRLLDEAELYDSDLPCCRARSQ